MNDLVDAAKGTEKPDARDIRTYTIPDSLRRGVCPETVGMRELSADEELQAAKIGRFDLTKTKYEAVKLAICKLAGKPVNNAEGEIDSFWNKCGPKLRSLLMQAHDKMAAASDEEEESFFASERVTG